MFWLFSRIMYYVLWLVNSPIALLLLFSAATLVSLVAALIKHHNDQGNREERAFRLLYYVTPLISASLAVYVAQTAFR